MAAARGPLKALGVILALGCLALVAVVDHDLRQARDARRRLLSLYEEDDAILDVRSDFGGPARRRARSSWWGD